MSETSKPARPVPPPLFSAMTLGDLGMRAAFWSGRSGEAVTFKPIVGWVTVMNVAERGGGDSILPVVQADDGLPIVQPFGLGGCIGIFRHSVSAEEARSRFESRRPPAQGRPTGFVS